MNRPLVALIVGTRPEAIKLAPLYRALEADGRARPYLVATGQHAELLDQALRDMRLVADASLAVMRPAQTLHGLTARLVQALGDALAELEPAWVVVQGDTHSALAGALCAYQQGLRLAHVEAGLRSGDLRDPFPEEGNRRLIGVLADLHFAPTPGARDHLLAEGVSEARVLVSGNTVVDAVRATAAEVRDQGLPDPTLAALAAAESLVLVTLHRRESFGPKLESVAQGLAELARRRPQATLAIPVHPNPAVGPVLRRHLDGLANVRLLPPLGYRDFVGLLGAARLLLTDSGGVQEEGVALGKPLLVVREATERPEALGTGRGRLIGTDGGELVREATALLDAPAEPARPSDAFGDGRAGERIAARLLEALP